MDNINELKPIGTTSSGNCFSVRGAFPFVGNLDISTLEWGDSIVDNDGRGMTMYVHRCASCGRRFLRGMLALVSVTCKECI